MSSIMLRVPTVLALVMAATVMAATGVASAQGDSTRTSVDWAGYYYGSVPCASCEGIDTWLSLDEAQGKTLYTLTETYRQAKPETFRSKGTASWQKDGSTVALKGKDENRVLFVSEGFAAFLGEGEKRPKDDSPYRLRKQDAYAGNGEQLLVDPPSVKKSDGKNGAQVAFDAVMNFQHKPEGGHKSLRAHVVVDCRKKEYTLPSIAYYAADFASGKLIHAEKKNENPPQHASGKDDVMGQAMEAYCAAP